MVKKTFFVLNQRWVGAPALNDPARVPKLPGDCSDAWRAVRGHVALAFVDDVHALCVTGSVPRFSFFERTRNCSSSLTILIVCVYKLFTILKKIFITIFEKEISTKNRLSGTPIFSEHGTLQEFQTAWSFLTFHLVFIEKSRFSHLFGYHQARERENLGFFRKL